jgi:hypothetical protein
MKSDKRYESSSGLEGLEHFLKVSKNHSLQENPYLFKSISLKDSDNN